MPRYDNEDQAHAWLYWGDETSVALVKPDGDFSFRDLRRRRERRPITSTFRAEWRNMGGATGITADGQPIYPRRSLSADLYARLSTPPPPRPQPVGEFEILRMNLYAACARGEIAACGRFHGGELEQIPAAEFAKGKRPEGWTDIRYSFEDLRRVFPPAHRFCSGPHTAPLALATHYPADGRDHDTAAVNGPQNTVSDTTCTTAVGGPPTEANAKVVQGGAEVIECADGTIDKQAPAKRRRKDEKRPAIANAARALWWKDGRLDLPSDLRWKDLCREVDSLLGWTLGKCAPRTLGRAIKDINDGKL
jgi:hypothetical protein